MGGREDGDIERSDDVVSNSLIRTTSVRRAIKQNDR